MECHSSGLNMFCQNRSMVDFVLVRGEIPSVTDDS